MKRIEKTFRGARWLHLVLLLEKVGSSSFLSLALEWNPATASPANQVLILLCLVAFLNGPLSVAVDRSLLLVVLSKSLHKMIRLLKPRL